MDIEQAVAAITECAYAHAAASVPADTRARPSWSVTETDRFSADMAQEEYRLRRAWGIPWIGEWPVGVT